MNRLALALLCVPALAWGAPPEWQEKLSPPEPGSFPAPPPLVAKYHFGWMKLGGGVAEAVLTRPRHDILQLEVSGGSTGLVRKLWKLDATHEAIAQASTLRPIRIKQTEDYGWDKITTEATYTEKGVTYLKRHASDTAATPEKPQEFSFPNLRDLWTALLYIRSQRLEPGDDYSLVVFPGNSPYLANVRVICKEPIRVRAGKFNALKFEISLQKITPTLGLEPHPKFKRAYAWLSDDENRILLRVEAEIFVGSVWMELQSAKTTGP